MQFVCKENSLLNIERCYSKHDSPSRQSAFKDTFFTEDLWATASVWKKEWYFSKYWFNYSSNMAFLFVYAIIKVITSKSIDFMKKHLEWCFGNTSPFLNNLFIKDLSKKHVKTLHLKTLLINHQNIHKLLIGMHRTFSGLSKSSFSQLLSRRNVNNISLWYCYHYHW